MDIGMPLADLAVLVGALAVAGVVVGVMAGLLGIGGGGILVPVLFETFGLLGVDESVRMHLALGTSMAVIIPTSLRSFSSHNAKGAVDMDFVRRLAPFVVLGVVLGALLAERASGDALKWVWVIFGSMMATKMAFGREDWRFGDDIPKSRLVEVYGVGVGLVSTLMSIGGGLFVIALQSFYGRPLLRTVATSSAFGPIIAIPAVFGYMWAGWGVPELPPLTLGYVSVLAAVLLIPTSVLTAPIGVHLAHGIPKRRLEITFAIFQFIVVTRFLINLLA